MPAHRVYPLAAALELVLVVVLVLVVERSRARSTDGLSDGDQSSPSGAQDLRQRPRLVGRLRHSQGKANGDGRARAHLAFDLQGAAVRLDDRPADRQAEAGAAGLCRTGTGRIYPVE